MAQFVGHDVPHDVGWVRRGIIRQLLDPRIENIGLHALSVASYKSNAESLPRQTERMRNDSHSEGGVARGPDACPGPFHLSLTALFPQDGEPRLPEDLSRDVF